MAWIYRDPLGYNDDVPFHTKEEAIEFAKLMEDDDCLETLAEFNVFPSPEPLYTIATDT